MRSPGILRLRMRSQKKDQDRSCTLIRFILLWRRSSRGFICYCITVFINLTIVIKNFGCKGPREGGENPKNAEKGEGRREKKMSAEKQS